jgi:ABC-type nitrate/sulfonate/bicarbonate transport system substrate-binding protein
MWRILGMSVLVLALAVIFLGRSWYQAVGPAEARAALKSIGVKLCFYAGGYAMLLVLQRLGIFKILGKPNE